MEITFVAPLPLVSCASWEDLLLGEVDAEETQELEQETALLVGEGDPCWRTSGWLGMGPECWSAEAAERLAEVAGGKPLLLRIGWCIEGAVPRDLLLCRLRLAGWDAEARPHVSLLVSGSDGRACMLETVLLRGLSAADLQEAAEGTIAELLAHRSRKLRARLSLTALAIGTTRETAGLHALPPAEPERPRLDWDEEESLTPIRTPLPEVVREVSTPEEPEAIAGDALRDAGEAAPDEVEVELSVEPEPAAPQPEQPELEEPTWREEPPPQPVSFDRSLAAELQRLLTPVSAPVPKPKLPVPEPAASAPDDLGLALVEEELDRLLAPCSGIGDPEPIDEG